jgi:hypothetical protein
MRVAAHWQRRAVFLTCCLLSGCADEDNPLQQEPDPVTAYCSYAAISSEQLAECVEHVRVQQILRDDTNAGRYARGELDQCLGDAGSFYAMPPDWTPGTIERSTAARAPRGTTQTFDKAGATIRACSWHMASAVARFLHRVPRRVNAMHRSGSAVSAASGTEVTVGDTGPACASDTSSRLTSAATDRNRSAARACAFSRAAGNIHLRVFSRLDSKRSRSSSTLRIRRRSAGRFPDGWVAAAASHCRSARPITVARHRLS